jgi:hypothetical protein
MRARSTIGTGTAEGVMWMSSFGVEVRLGREKMKCNCLISIGIIEYRPAFSALRLRWFVKVVKNNAYFHDGSGFQKRPDGCGEHPFSGV